eukprot:5838018-Heterocapsa_arctica.AAC.1
MAVNSSAHPTDRCLPRLRQNVMQQWRPAFARRCFLTYVHMLMKQSGAISLCCSRPACTS